jgi:hypothetical protein
MVIYLPSEEAVECQGRSLAGPKSRFQYVTHYTGILVVEYKPTNKEKILILLTAN